MDRQECQMLRRGNIVEYRAHLYGGEVKTRWGRFQSWGERGGKPCAWVRPRHGTRYDSGIVTPVEVDDLIAIRKPPRQVRHKHSVI